MVKMIYQVDTIDDVVLLINERMEVVDAFAADGITRHECLWPVTHYTYRKLLTPPGVCCLCGATIDEIEKPCISSGGFHAFAGMGNDPGVPDQHKAEFRSVSLIGIHFEELAFFVEADNLFPADQIRKAMVV